MNILSIIKSDRSFHVWLFLGILCSVLGMTSTVRASTAQIVSNKLINSIATNDFMSLFSVYSIYQDRVADIRSNNPKVLWKRLEDEYYSKEKTDYENRAVNNDFTWNAFLSGNSLNIPYWKKVFNTGKYSAIEEKQENGFSPKTGRNISYTIVYYNYAAPDAMSSMPLNDKLVKEFIFSVQVSSGKVFGVETLTNSYIYWPSTDENKIILARKYAEDSVKPDYLSSIRVLKDATGQEALALRQQYLYREAFNNYIAWPVSADRFIKEIHEAIKGDPKLIAAFHGDSLKIVEKQMKVLAEKRKYGLNLHYLHEYFPADSYISGNYVRELLYNVEFHSYPEHSIKKVSEYAGVSKTTNSIIELLNEGVKRQKSRTLDRAYIDMVNDTILQADAAALYSDGSKFYRSQNNFLEYIELRPDNVLRYHEYRMGHPENSIGSCRIDGNSIVYTKKVPERLFGPPGQKATYETVNLKYDGKSITDPDGEQYILIE